MANASAIWQHAAHLLAAEENPYRTAYLLKKNTEEFSG